MSEWLIAAIVVAVVLPIGAFLYWHLAVLEWLALRGLTKMRITSIADAADGKLLRLTGTVRYVGEPIRAPVTERECAAWTIRMDQKHYDTEKRSWSTVHGIAEVDRAVDFWLEDETGRARVIGPGARLVIVRDTERELGMSSDAEAIARIHGEVADQCGAVVNPQYPSGWLKYREGVIEEGERVSVSGVGRWEVDLGSDGGGYRGGGRYLLVSAPPKGQVVLTDAPAATGAKGATSAPPASAERDQ